VVAEEGAGRVHARTCGVAGFRVASENLVLTEGEAADAAQFVVVFVESFESVMRKPGEPAVYTFRTVLVKGSREAREWKIIRR
jgi:hypothetical protein